MTAALVGTMAANVFYLTMSFLYFYVFAMLVLATPVVFSPSAMKVAVLTTSYPREPGDPAGNFVADAVERLRGRGVEVEVVSPGLVPPLRDRLRRGDRRQPAARALARGSPAGDARELRAGGAARFAGRRPRARPLAPLGRRRARRRGSRSSCSSGGPTSSSPGGPRGSPGGCFAARGWSICASNALADSARELGAREVRVIPSGVEMPEAVAEQAEPPHVLFAGRLSPEKGILELVEAANGMTRVVAGDGPLRDRVPGALGFVPHDAARRAVRAGGGGRVPSHREGFGVVCAEAMAYGRPVVAGAVGGLLDLVADGETGLLVPPRDVPALREALERLIGDRELRRRMGEAARERVRSRFAWPAVTDATLAAYEEALA